jgi:hypothetical protein
MSEQPEQTQMTILFRPTGDNELGLIRQLNSRAFPPRLYWQPIFYPVLFEEYARQIARHRNAKGGRRDYVTRFAVETAYRAQVAIHQVGSSLHQEYWIPAEELEEFNRHIVGPIEVIAEYESAPSTPAPTEANGSS